MSIAPPIVLVAAGIVLDEDGRVLIASRPAGKSMAGLWEFPGGKRIANETPEQALVRECMEELDITLNPDALIPLTFISQPLDAAQHLLMPLFVCRDWQGTPTAREGQTLAWVASDRLGDYPFVPADRRLLPQLPAWLSVVL